MGVKKNDGTDKAGKSGSVYFAAALGALIRLRRAPAERM